MEGFYKDAGKQIEERKKFAGQLVKMIKTATDQKLMKLSTQVNLHLNKGDDNILTA